MITRLFSNLDRQAATVLPTLARLVFAAVLARYFLASAFTKLDGVTLSANAFIQILPNAMEKVGYDHTQLTIFHHVIVWGGTIAEFVLPVLIIVGLLTRPAALAMIGFIVVQSATDLWGHGIDAATFGTWFDKDSASLVLDQRSLWITTLAILVMLGAGPLSIDSIARRFYNDRRS